MRRELVNHMIIFILEYSACIEFNIIVTSHDNMK